MVKHPNFQKGSFHYLRRSKQPRIEMPVKGSCILQDSAEKDRTKKRHQMNILPPTSIQLQVNILTSDLLGIFFIRLNIMDTFSFSCSIKLWPSNQYTILIELSNQWPNIM